MAEDTPTTTRKASKAAADSLTAITDEQVPAEVREAVAAGRVQTRTLEEAAEVGYFGDPVDPRPNSAYALENEEERQRLAAEGKSIDRPPSVEQVGPPRAIGEQALAAEAPSG